MSKLRSLPTVWAMFRAWCTEPSDYRAQVGYFERRGLLEGTQLLIGCCAALIAVIPVISQRTPNGPSAHVAQAISTIAAASALAWAFAWWFGPWPSRRWSIAFIVWADVGISVVSALESNAIAGVGGLNVLLLVAVYVKFFDGPRVLMAHTLWTLCWVLYFWWRIGTGEHADPYLATSKSLVAIAVLVATPIFVQFGIWVLRSDANSAMVDDLTGLLNRRGLHLQLGELLADIPEGSAVIILVIDLDRFKAINDAHGHAVGDEVLVRTARRIRATTRGTALVARTGGEEFVVVEVAAPQHGTAIAERIRRSVAAPADRATVTASIGATVMSRAHFADPLVDSSTVLERAISDADDAMFAAKRQGGDAALVLAR